MNYSNSEICRAIDEYIHNSKYRDVLKDYYTNGLSHKELAKTHGYSLSQIKRIIYKSEDKLFKGLTLLRK